MKSESLDHVIENHLLSLFLKQLLITISPCISYMYVCIRTLIIARLDNRIDVRTNTCCMWSRYDTVAHLTIFVV
jgi:hypothetical protein